MAAFNRSRMEIPPFGGGYAKNEFYTDRNSRVGYPPLRNFNDPRSRNPYEAGASQFQRFPGSGDFYGRPQFPVAEQMRGSASFRSRPHMHPTNNRMPPPSMLNRQPFQGPDFHRNDMPPSMRMPGVGFGERFFVPWNQRPKPYYGPSPPSRFANNKPGRDQRSSPTKPGESVQKKKNRNRKYHPRPREDAKRLKPWMTDEIYDEVRKKNELYIKAKKEDKPELWQEFKVLRNQVSSMVKDAKMKAGLITRKTKEALSVEKPHSCDTCDRAFVEESDLEKHLQEHIQCDYEGCSFKAHPKVVDLHKRMLHETGYADVISKLNNTEEVQKWRNERKSHYPTAENIKKRKAELSEKVARGEIIETQQFGKFKRQRLEHDSGPRTRRVQGRSRHPRGKRRPGANRGVKLPPSQPEKAPSDSDSDNDAHINLPKFAGLSLIENISDNSVPSQGAINPQLVDDFTNDIGNQADAQQNENCMDLLSGSGQCNMNICEIDDDGPSVEAIVHSEDNTLSVDCSVMPCKNPYHPESDDEGPSVEPILKSEVNDSLGVETISLDVQAPSTERSSQPSDPAEKEPISKNNQHAVASCDHKVVHSRSWPSGLSKNNLLDKLLANEVRHERNVILQCIRYTVNNDFFGLE